MDSPDAVIDLLVIGGGTAGLVGATTASSLGASVTLVERLRTGGDCLWTGCVPSKTLLWAAAASARRRTLTGEGNDYGDVRARVSAAIAAIEPDDSPETLRAAGVAVLSGTARFTSPHEADVDGRRIRFRQALVATGSSPLIPDVSGLGAANVVTSETVWELDHLPGRLVIIGGGPVGCELGQAFARLGSQVTILTRSTLLRREGGDAAAAVRASLQADGVQVLEHAGIDHVENHDDGSSTVHTRDGRTFGADVILSAVGRRARTEDLGLELAGVDRDGSGRILVDATMRSSRPSIWAAGDVTAYPQYTHLAGVHGSTAAFNAVLGIRRRVSKAMPRVTYTSPEVAAVGVTEPAGPWHTTSTFHFADNDRAITEQRTPGFARIILDRRGRILGGTIVGARAGESLGELTLAVERKLTTRDLTAVTHPYPTYNDALWNAAIQHVRAGLRRPAPKTALDVLRRVNRWRGSRSEGASRQA